MDNSHITFYSKKIYLKTARFLDLSYGLKRLSIAATFCVIQLVLPLIRFKYAQFRPQWFLKWVYTVQPLLTGQVMKGIYQSPKNIVNKISLLTGHLHMRPQSPFGGRPDEGFLRLSKMYYK